MFVSHVGSYKACRYEGLTAPVILKSFGRHTRDMTAHIGGWHIDIVMVCLDWMEELFNLYWC